MRKEKQLVLLSDLLFHRDKFRTEFLSRELLEKIKRSHKYVLDEAFLEVAANIEKTSDSNILKALPLARLPYSEVWIEFDEKLRRKYMYPTIHKQMNKDRASRLGLFVEVRHGDGHRQRVTVQVITVHDNGTIHHCPFDIHMDWSAFPMKIMPYAPAVFQKLLTEVNALSGANFTHLTRLLANADVPESIAEVKFSQTEEDAISDWLWRFKLCCSLYQGEFWSAAAMHAPVPKQVLRDIMADGINIANHGRFLFCIVCLLNSKNMLTETLVDPLNIEHRTRGNRNTSPKGDAYKIVSIERITSRNFQPDENCCLT